MPARTLDRILDGAMDAVARHGLAKLEMSDVSASAGVSRGTVYRYFSNREALVKQLAQREGMRFEQEMLAAIEQAPPGPERVLVALRQATSHVRRHRALQRLLETDPAFLLRALKAELPRLETQLAGLLGPLLEQTRLVRSGVVPAEHLVNWMLRLMVSAFLFPEAHPDDMATGLTAVYRMLTAPVRPATETAARRASPARNASRAKATRRSRAGLARGTEASRGKRR